MIEIVFILFRSQVLLFIQFLWNESQQWCQLTAQAALVFRINYLVKTIHWQQGHPWYVKTFDDLLSNGRFTRCTSTANSLFFFFILFCIRKRKRMNGTVWRSFQCRFGDFARTTRNVNTNLLQMVRPVAQHNYTMEDGRLCRWFDCSPEWLTHSHRLFSFDLLMWCVVVVDAANAMNLLKRPNPVRIRFGAQTISRMPSIKWVCSTYRNLSVI